MMRKMAYVLHINFAADSVTTVVSIVQIYTHSLFDYGKTHTSRRTIPSIEEERRIENVGKGKELFFHLRYNPLDTEKREKVGEETGKRKCQHKSQFETIVLWIHGD